MNKLKPYQEPETTQAYALQILACHLLEAKIKDKKNHLPKNSDITQSPTTTHSQSKEMIISHTRPTRYQETETLEAEDLEVHQIMQEGYWAQPSTFKNTTSNTYVMKGNKPS